MSFGITAYGHDNSVSLSSEVPAMVFMGKATRVTGTGLTFYGYDQGATSVTCLSGSSACGPGQTITMRMADDNGVFTYSIESPNKPTVFINSTSTDIYGTVFGIASTGSYGVNGWPIWYIKICISYPLGTREAALPYINVYCFDKIPNESTTGNGIAVYDGSSKLTFSSQYKPLKVKDIVLLSSTDNPTELQDLKINKSYLSNPVTPMFQIVKPAFLNVEWGRYVDYNSIAHYGCTLTVCDPWCRCVRCGYRYNRYNQTFVTGGINVNSANNDLVINLIGQQPGTVECGTSSPVNYFTKNERLPIYIPVISGADYD